MWRFFLINLALSGLAVFLSFRLYGILTMPMEEVHPPQKKTLLGKEKTEAPQIKKDTGVYQVIVQKDLFRPSRTESKPDTAKSGLPPTLPPKLFGVMIMDNDKIAILEDPASKRKKTYRVKDSIGDFVVSDIEKDKIILLRGEEKVVVNLREIKTITSPARPATVPPRPAPRPSPAPYQRPPVPAPPPQPTPTMPEVIEEFPGVAPLPEFGP